MPMTKAIRISEAAERLGVTPQHLRILEWEGRIPPARRDFNGRIYGEFDIAFLQSMGFGSWPSRRKPADEVVGQSL